MSDNKLEGVDFSWDDESAVVVEQVDAIAVYTNPKGRIVIRQAASMGDDDSVIVIPRSQVENLILALQNEIAD